jgi:hypothetical protein
VDAGNSSVRDHLSTGPISVLMFASATVRRGAEEHILELLSRSDRRISVIRWLRPDATLRSACENS